LSSIQRIHLLEQQLANQIAAGEVVERPASVIKELIENSLDSGASNILVEVSRGGIRQMRVSDNGSGIVKDDLSLALTRHATSKIIELSDLEAIGTLGFRGEALASISSVSRLVLTSRIAGQPHAWQAICEGRDMQVSVQPAASPVGTSVEVNDLFYNTPARQKFLKAEKTEFTHIENVFIAHALANLSVEMILKHNGRVVRKIPAVVSSIDSNTEETKLLKRLAACCGKKFADHAIRFDCEHELANIYGWVSHPDFHRSESDIQYIFVNGRPVKDKTLSHAIRQVYDPRLPSGRMSAFVIFLTIDLSKVDVNVHPTKHEVRFEQQRLIHDLLVKSLDEALSSEIPSLFDGVNHERENQSSNDYISNSYPSSNYHSRGYGKSREIAENYFSQYNQDQISASSASNVYTRHNGDVQLVHVTGNFWLYKRNKLPLLIDEKLILKYFLDQVVKNNKIVESKGLLFPAKICLNESVVELANVHQRMTALGFEYKADKHQTDSQVSMIINKVPLWLCHEQTDSILEMFKLWFQTENMDSDRLIESITDSFEVVSADMLLAVLDVLNGDEVNSSGCCQLSSGLLKNIYELKF